MHTHTHTHTGMIDLYPSSSMRYNAFIWRYLRTQKTAFRGKDLYTTLPGSLLKYFLKHTHTLTHTRTHTHMHAQTHTDHTVQRAWALKITLAVRQLESDGLSVYSSRSRKVSSAWLIKDPGYISLHSNPAHNPNSLSTTQPTPSNIFQTPPSLSVANTYHTHQCPRMLQIFHSPSFLLSLSFFHVMWSGPLPMWSHHSSLLRQVSGLRPSPSTTCLCNGLTVYIIYLLWYFIHICSGYQMEFSVSILHITRQPPYDR